MGKTNKIILEYDNESKALYSNVGVYFKKFNLKINCRAQWDTGTPVTLLADKIVFGYDLYSDRFVNVKPAGNKLVPSYLFEVNLFLADDFILNNLSISHLGIHKADILIGMDIIMIGNLSIKNIGGVKEYIFTYIPTKNEKSY